MVEIDMKVDNAYLLAEILRLEGWAVAIVGPKAMAGIGTTREEVEEKLENSARELFKGEWPDD